VAESLDVDLAAIASERMMLASGQRSCATIESHRPAKATLALAQGVLGHGDGRLVLLLVPRGEGGA
jgi:hypothetical protein